MTAWDLRRAADLSDAAVKRQATVRIGQVEGALTGVYGVGEAVHVCLNVGGSAAWFALTPDAEVEVKRS